MSAHNASASAALVHPTPEVHRPAHDDKSSGGRKRPAEDELDRSFYNQNALATAAGSNGTVSDGSPELSGGSRKVLAPGATKAAMARLAEMRGLSASTSNSGGGPPLQGSACGTHAGVAPGSGGKKVLAPGATQAALARLASLNSAGNVPAVSSLPEPLPLPAAAPLTSTGSRKVLSPGATQAALARLATLKTGGTVPPAAHVPLPPPPRPLFSPLDFSVGTIVWAKMPSYPWWPAQVQRPSPEQMRLKHASSDIFIVFYGTADYNWMPVSDLRPFRVNLPDYGRFAGSKNKALQRAIDDAWVGLGQPRPDIMGKLIG